MTDSASTACNRMCAEAGRRGFDVGAWSMTESASACDCSRMYAEAGRRGFELGVWYLADCGLDGGPRRGEISCAIPCGFLDFLI